MCADFFVKIVHKLLNSKIYTLTPSFVEIYVKMTKLCCINQDISQHSERCLYHKSGGGSEKGRLVGDADLEMDGVTADAVSDHRCQAQPCRQSSARWSSPPPCWCVFVAALPRWSAGRLSTHQSPYLWLEFMILSLRGALAVIVKRVQIWRVWGHSVFSINTRQFACSQLCMTLERREMGEGLSIHSDCCFFAPCTDILTYLLTYTPHNFATFRYISTKLGTWCYNVYFLV